MFLVSFLLLGAATLANTAQTVVPMSSRLGPGFVLPAEATEAADTISQQPSGELPALLQRLISGGEDEARAWQLRLQHIQEGEDLSPSEQIEAAMQMLVAASTGIEVRQSSSIYEFPAD